MVVLLCFGKIVVRSVRDIDNGDTRKYLYSIPIPQGHGFFPFSIPPTELNTAIKARVPSPSGECMLILREERVAPDDIRQVFEIWTKTAECLTNRIVLPKTLHGKVIHQPGGLGSLAWNADEWRLYTVPNERHQKQHPSLIRTPRHKHVGLENVLGVGREERWG
jgi:hypothetical protein